MEERNPHLGCELAVKTRSNIRKEGRWERSWAIARFTNRFGEILTMY